MKPFHSVVKTVILSVNQLPSATAKPLKLCTPLAWLSASIILCLLAKRSCLNVLPCVYPKALYLVLEVKWTDIVLYYSYIVLYYA